MNQTTNNLYMIVSWVMLVAGVYLVLGDLLNAAGAVSAYVLYRIIGSMHSYESEKAYYDRMSEEINDKPDEAKGQ